MVPSIKLVNQKAFFRKLNSVVPAVVDDITVANSTSADDFVAMAQRLVPVKTGALRDSIRKSKAESPTGYIVEAGGPTTTVGGYDYALGQEFGTKNIPSSPFFWPTYRVQKKPTKRRALKALRSGIKRTGFGGKN